MPDLTFRKLLLGNLYIWVVATWEIVSREVAHGKMALGMYLLPIEPVLDFKHML